MNKINLEEKLTNNFRLKEFLRNRWFDEEDEKIADKLYLSNQSIRANIQILAIQLQNIRDYVSKKEEKDTSITITISLRPVPYEIKNGRSGKSKHTLGLAADLTSSIGASKLHKYILELIDKGIILDGGLGLYVKNNFVHYDFSLQNKGRRW